MKILSPAKINLFLIVKGKREDGYHELLTLFCRIGIYDTISMEINRKDISVYCADPNVPNDKTNLAHKAADTFFLAAGTKNLKNNSGVRISIDKKIPVGAGLGGGSSNAASVLLGLNQYFNNPFSKNDLMEMALTIGADVPFFIHEKPAIATGIGEKLTSFAELYPYKIVLIFPGKSISTKAVYKNLNLGLTKCEQKLKGFLFKEKVFRAEQHLCNDLETVTTSICPEISLIKKELLNLGADGSLMTGSGPTVFGLFSDAAKAESAYHGLIDNDNWKVFISDLII